MPEESRRSASQGSHPRDITTSADAMVTTSLGLVSKCEGQTPAGIMYSTDTESLSPSPNTLTAKSANAEFVQTTMIGSSSATARPGKAADVRIRTDAMHTSSLPLFDLNTPTPICNTFLRFRNTVARIDI